ncbi:MAG: tetratricopeptide repeat protein, partial [Myxococcota bacterium]
MPRRLMGLFLLFLVACAGRRTRPVDPLEVDLHRARISKVRHAIAETRSVLASTVGEVHQPELTMRLAELTSEEARHHYLVALARQKGRAEALHLPQVRLLKEQAIGIYRTLLARWPDGELADRAQFAISQEQRELGQIEAMTQTLAELLERFPDSPFRGESLLLLGNHHYDKGRLTEARERYLQLLALDDPELNGMAQYKLAWVYVNQGVCDKAVYRFERALLAERSRPAHDVAAQVGTGRWTDDGEAFAVPSTPRSLDDVTADEALDVSREALVDVTFCYAQVGDPKTAVAYFRKWAPSRAAYVAALGKMARRYATVEQPLGAANVSRELLRLGPDAPERIDDGRLLHSTLTKTQDFSRVGDDVTRLLEIAGRRRMAPELAGEQREQLMREFEGLTRDLLLRAHRMAEEGGTSPWTDRPTDRDQTITGYLAWQRTFPAAEDAGDLYANVAELLLDAERPLEAAERFERAADAYGREEKPREAADARYQAAFAYQQSLGASESRVDTVLARAGLRRVGGAWLATASDSPQARAMAFSIARSYHEEGNHAAAVDLLTAVAWAYPQFEEGQAAAMLVLDAHYALNQLTGLLRAGQR